MKSPMPQNAGPPKWAIRLFRRFCNDHLCDAVLGDMLELYDRRFIKVGKRKADWLFVWNVVQFLQPFALKKTKKSQNSNNAAMFKSYLKVAWRSMARQKMYTSIKIGGFALGIAACILITLFIKQELSYDKFYKDGENIYRVYNEFGRESGANKWTSFPAPTAGIFKAEFPEVEKSGRLIPYAGWFNAGSNLFRAEGQEQNTYEEGFVYADQALLDILQVPMVYGQTENALADPYSIVISKTVADKYFPNDDPVGKVVFLNDDQNKPYKIGGVMQDFPDNTHLQFDFLITLTGVEFWGGEQTSWCCWNYNIYFELQPGTDPKELEAKLLSVRDTHYVGHLEKEGNQSVDEVRKNHFFKLQPVADIYLYSDGIHAMVEQGDIRFVWLFGGVAFFVLLLACINFINLSTAKSANRAKEVGMRKVVGSVRAHLVRQFLTESVLYSVVSFVVGILLAWISMPFFNELADKSLKIPWLEWWFIPTLGGAATLVGVLAGLYPAFYLSGFKPIDVLKGSLSRGSKSSRMRSVMVIFQFTTSVVLIIGTFIIYRQMQYILNKKIGFNKEQVVLIQGANTLGDKIKTLKAELANLSGVQNAAISGYLPISGTKRDGNPFWREGKSKEDKAVGAQRWYVDSDYIGTLGMHLVDGRNFVQGMASDSSSIIVNQAFVKEFGFENPVGERIQNWKPYTIIGVVEDFHFESLKGKIEPLTMVYGEWGDVVSVKVSSPEMKEVLASIKEVWDDFAPNQPMRYSFLDESYARMYEDVQTMGRVFTTFAVLAIIVACLGLFALSAYMVEQRGKEISIRIVLGASGRVIFSLLTFNFIKLVLISLLLAMPLGWYLMKSWLDDYTYRTDITWEVFAISGLMALGIAVLTISFESIKASRMNPIKSLRSE
ncbi:ABC transporter permease [Imperialibacter roseus]|uniref:ABC transporter permease n=1 Tax=Imperialibacter roseus TaxID=1324217 RepID=A0ABZ0IRC1_9BACT|nr:ABC transporter permease [Imperialibacter roseus]WOK07549.1 ABC transporter permease [Imperialibacter roseus]